MEHANHNKQPQPTVSSKERVNHSDKELQELIIENESLKQGISKIYKAIDKPDSNSIQTN